MHLARTPGLLGLLTLFTVGCDVDGVSLDSSVNGDLPPEAAAEGSSRYGLVVLTHGPGDDGVTVSGQFAAFHGADRVGVLHALAVEEQAWVGDEPAPGHCQRLRAVAPEADPDGLTAPSIDLLSAGHLTVRAATTTPLRLTPRALPQALLSMQGVIYGAEDPEALPYQPDQIYEVQATGDEVGSAWGRVVAPGPIALESVQARDDHLEIRWSGHDEISVTLFREAGPQADGLRCAARGEGLRLPLGALSALGSGEIRLTVARVHHAPLRMSGLDAADLVFVSSDTTTFELPEIGALP